MGFGERLKELREGQGYSQKEFAKMIHVSSSAISHFENGANYPKPMVLVNIMSVLKCDANYLYQDYIDQNKASELTVEEYDLIEKYRKLSPHGREAVDAIVNIEYKASRVFLEKGNMISIGMYVPMLRNNAYVITTKPKKIYISPSALNRQADYCLKIVHNRYRPTFDIGDVALVKKMKLRHNEIGLFEVDGLIVLKKFTEYHGKKRLLSINVTDPNIDITEETNFRILGRVIGKLDGDYVEA